LQIILTGKGSATAGLFPRVELGGFACRLEPDSRSERSIPIDDHVGEGKNVLKNHYRKCFFRNIKRNCKLFS
jgi:hypothetical protein